MPVDPPTLGTDPHFLAAELGAATLLALVPLPPGAEPVSAPPSSSSVLDEPPSSPASQYLVDRAAWWIVPGTMDTVIDWVKTHAPPGSMMPASGEASDHGVVEWEAAGWAFAPFDQTLTLRQLSVMVAPDGSDTVGLRADAQVIWDPLRAPSSLISEDAIRSVTVMELAGFGGDSATTTTIAPTVTSYDRSVVEHFVTVVNELPVDADSPLSCPAWTGFRFEVDFNGMNGSAVAAISGDEAQCGGFSLVVDGKQQAAVSDPQQVLLDLVSSTLHVPLA